jgi:hypothetical protein
MGKRSYSAAVAAAGSSKKAKKTVTVADSDVPAVGRWSDTSLTYL